MIGTTIGRYRVVDLAGRGGMGDVYRAWDQTLQRDVAIKVLKPGALGNEEARRRFRAEALVLSRLNHPNIATIHDFISSEQLDCLVMEYISGKNLSDVLARGPLDGCEVARLGIQLVEGLCVAHREGIVHRDLKPANILVTVDGRLKVTDFGLAKLLENQARFNSNDASTASNAIAGTFPFMAPEQLTGGTIDERTDIYATGNILYSMATGRLPFGPASGPTLLNHILSTPPTPPGEARPGLSPFLENIILKCLEKHPEERYQSAKELLVDLRRLGSLKMPAPYVAPVSRRFSRLRNVLLAAAAGALVVFLFFTLYDRYWSGAIPECRLDQITRTTSWEGAPVFSPDGRYIAYVSNAEGSQDIYLMELNSRSAIRRTTEISSDVDPAWFPDGMSLAFASDRDGSWKIYRMDKLSGAATPMIPSARFPALSPSGGAIAYSKLMPDGMYRIFTASIDDASRERQLTFASDGMWNHERPAWSPDGRLICYAARQNLWLVPAEGGSARKLTTDNEADSNPCWSPDGQHVYFSSRRNGIVGIWRIDARGGTPEPLPIGAAPGSHPSISPDRSRMVYSSESVESSLVLRDLATGSQARLSDYPDDFQASFGPRSDRAVYVSNRTGPDHSLWIQAIRNARPEGIPFSPLPRPEKASHPAFSPDGEWIAYYRIAGEERSIWIVRSSGDSPIRFTDDPGSHYQPAWAPSGTALAYCSDVDGKAQIFVTGITSGRATGSARRVTQGVEYAIDPAWSPDGKSIAFVGTREGRDEVWLVPSTGGAARELTRGAGARRVAWDYKTGRILVSGVWKEERCSLLSVDPATGAMLPFSPRTLFGTKEAKGYFDLSRDGRLLLLAVEEMRGDLFVLNAVNRSF